MMLTVGAERKTSITEAEGQDLLRQIATITNAEKNIDQGPAGIHVLLLHHLEVDMIIETETDGVAGKIIAIARVKHKTAASDLIHLLKREKRKETLNNFYPKLKRCLWSFRTILTL